MKHDCNQELLLTSMSTDIKDISKKVDKLSDNVLSRLPVVEEKCKQSARWTSFVTSSFVSIFLSVTLTLLSLAFKEK